MLSLEIIYHYSYESYVSSSEIKTFCVTFKLFSLHLKMCVTCDISNREGVFHRISEHQEASFLTDFAVAGYLMKESFECLILLPKGISILRDIWDQSWRNFMLT